MSAQRTLGAALAVGMLAWGVACGREEAAPEAGPPPVLVERVGTEDVVERIEATGELRAKAEAQVAAQVDGQITSVAVAEGQAVAAGATLLEIDPGRRLLERDSVRARVAEAQARLREKERDIGRIRTLGAQGAVSRARMDQAETELELARTQLAAARANLGLAERSLRDSTVRAPFAAHVARRLVSRGEFVTPGQALFELVTLDPVEVEFHLSEVDSGRVALGDRVEVRVAPFPEEVFTATVSVVSPTLDSRTRTLRVKGEIPNVDGRLRPGLFARADLGVEERLGVPMVPQEAVLRRATGPVAFLLQQGGRVRRVSVETGVYRDQRVEIRSGLEPGDWVVVRGHVDLADGAPVSPRNLDGTPAALDLAAQ